MKTTTYLCLALNVLTMSFHDTNDLGTRGWF